MKKSIYALLTFYSMGIISPVYTIGGFFAFWLITVLMQPILFKVVNRVGSYLLGDNEFEYVDLDTQVGAKVLILIKGDDL